MRSSSQSKLKYINVQQSLLSKQHRQQQQRIPVWIEEEKLGRKKALEKYGRENIQVIAMEAG